MKPNYKSHMGYTLQRYIIWEMQTRESARIIDAHCCVASIKVLCSRRVY